MANLVCPWWLGYCLVNPLRRLFNDPGKILGPYVRQGMTVLDVGPGMGYFTLPLARMAGEGGKVIAVDIQEKMLAGLRRRAEKRGLSGRIETRLASKDSLGLEDCAGKIDFALAFAVVHEVPDQDGLFAQLHAALKKDAILLIAEPRGHVGPAAFRHTLDLARGRGFRTAEQRGRTAVLVNTAP